MSSLTFRTTADFELSDCWSCGLTNAVPQRVYDKARNDTSEPFYCSGCGKGQYFGTSRLEEERELAAAAARRAASNARRAQEAEARAEVALAQAAKVNRRAAAGVCPCCDRSFPQMADHIRTKHPEYLNDMGEHYSEIVAQLADFGPVTAADFVTLAGWGGDGRAVAQEFRRLRRDGKVDQNDNGEWVLA